MLSKKLITTAALLALTLACSTAEPVSDDAPTEEEMADYGQDFDMSEPDEEVELSAEDVLRAAADGEHRSEEDRQRNLYRNPVDTLQFFGFEPGQQVLEIWPGGGWYTGVLAPATGAETPLRVALFAVDEDNPEDYRTRITGQYLDWVEHHRAELGPIEKGTLAPPEVIDLGEPESVDLVVTFRNMHNMHNNGVLDDVLAGIHGVLKSGGTFGVVQHRAPQGSDPDETAPKGYLPEQFVIDTVEAAGFVLEESSEINANPRDTADHEHGVWSLPPSLRGGEEDGERYLEIGESDRMTLRFTRVDVAEEEADADVEAEEAADVDAEAAQ
jgi:predicted methyltransferase